MRVELSASLKATQESGTPFAARFTPEMMATLVTTLGTAANMADRLYVAQRTVASATNDDIDLAGVLEDAFGNALTFAELVAIFIINAPRTGNPNTTPLTIGAGSNPVTGFMGGTTPTIGPLRPGAAVMLMAPDAAGLGAVTPGTADILRVANASGAANTYQIAILGRSVA